MTTPHATGTRCFRRLATVFALIVAAAAFMATPASSATRELSVGCVDSHRSNDDPIIHPGKPGVNAHMHEFTGSWSTNADSTYESMTRSGHTCELEGDTAGYWTPALFNAKHQLIRKRYSSAYYYGKHVSDDTKIHPFPAGLKIIARMSDGHGSGWHCGEGENNAQTQQTIPNCKGKDDGPGGDFPDVTLLRAKVVFPDCLKLKDGQPILDSDDHRSHMKYSDIKKNCGAGYMHVPRLALSNIYDTYGGPGITLSHDGDLPSSMHADFWNTWDQDIFEDLVEFCLNGNKPAGAGSLKCGGGLKSLENPNYPLATEPGDSMLPGQTAFKWPPPPNEDKALVELKGVGLSDGDKGVSGTVVVEAVSKVNVKISRVEFGIDTVTETVKNSSTPINHTPQHVAASSPYRLHLDTRCLSDGKHEIAAEAIGVTGRRGHPVEPLTLTTTNPGSPPADCSIPDHEPTGDGGVSCLDSSQPPAAPTNLVAIPAPGSATAIQLSWEPSSELDVAKYNVLRGGKKIGEAGLTATYLDTQLKANTDYTYTVQAVDLDCNVSDESDPATAKTSASSPTAPTVTLSGPGLPEGEPVRGTIRFTATAAADDGSTVDKVEFRVDGGVKLTDLQSPYVFDLDTTTLDDGEHTVSARAVDGPKDFTTVPMTIVVSNADSTKPTTPKSLKATEVTSNAVTLSWKTSTDPGAEPSGIQYYNVFRNGSLIDRDDECITTPPGQDDQCIAASFRDENRSSKTKYRYVVQAVDGSKNTSALSGSKTVTTK